MKILLLGTGGADGIPALYGNDRVSNHAREVGGKDIRSRASALIDGCLKIDLGPDTLSQMNRERLSARDWSAVIFTHSDEDHLAVSEIQYGLFPFVDLEHLDYTIYCNAVIRQKIKERYPAWPMDLVETKSFMSFQHEAYQVTPVRANHKNDEDCHNLLIESNGKKFLYATDTGMYSEETFEFLAGKQIDAIVIEATDGFVKTPYVGHMDIAQCVEVISRLRESGGLKVEARVVTTHHSAGGNATHDELVMALLPYQIEPGFDGLIIEI